MKKLASGMVILAGILWGSMGIFVRKFKECGLGSLDIVAIRAITTMCILFLFLLFYNRSLLRIKLRDLWCFLGTGLLSIGGVKDKIKKSIRNNLYLSNLKDAVDIDGHVNQFICAFT